MSFSERIILYSKEDNPLRQIGLSSFEYQMNLFLSQTIGLFSFHAFTPSRSCNLLYLNEMLWRIHSSRMLHSVSCTYSLWRAVVVRIHLQNVRFRPFLYDFGRSALDGCSVKLHVKDVSFTLFCSGTACCKAVKAWRLRLWITIGLWDQSHRFACQKP